MSDIVASEYPHFFQKQHDEAVNRYIIGRSKVYKITRQNYEKKVRKRLTLKIWRDERYDPIVLSSLTPASFHEEGSIKMTKPEVEALIYDQKAGLKWNEELQEWYRPGEEPVDPVGAVGATAPVNEVKESLRDWTKDIEGLFSEGNAGGDIWGEDETGEDAGDDDTKEEKTEEKPEAGETEGAEE